MEQNKNINLIEEKTRAFKNGEWYIKGSHEFHDFLIDCGIGYIIGLKRQKLETNL